MRVVQAHAPGDPFSTSRGRRLHAHPPPLAAAASLVPALLAALLILSRAHGVGAAAGDTEQAVNSRDCPQHQRGSSILDLPDTSDCRRLVRLMASCLPSWNAAEVHVEPGSSCCEHAASFFTLQCHCWSSQFDGAVVAGVGGIDDACSPGTATDTSPGRLARQQQQQDEQQQQQQAQQPQAQLAGGGGNAAAESSTLSRLAGRVFGGGGSSQQQAIRLRTADTAQQQQDIRLYVGVLSASAKREARDAIRASWAQHPAAHRLRFFLARPADDALFAQVREEAVQKRDLVVLGHITEHYANITHQTLEVLRLAAADPTTTHVLKTDDDSYVHFGPLLHRLSTLPRERLFFGNIENPGGQPHREEGHQWHVSREEWPADRFPVWAHGAGYVLSADLAVEVAAGTAYAASVGGHLFKLEDIAVGSWLEWAAQQRGFELHLAQDKRFNFGGCRFGDLVSHYIKPQQQLCMWAQQGRCKGC
ncbi:hypothetical protein D9Q98_007095 [Chlorella vulgaris]|uniref:Hexosyltransferase n=1 Tax=Chlorella vulgaris TaxID=3077 RepID=A0A9D4YUN4_CHLVU|nr:hypothetical protein D9Q98_007095 [Chlorella vulgaris]